LKGPVKPLDARFPLRDGGCLDANPKGIAGSGELREGILLLIGLAQQAIFEDGPPDITIS
jgi:hypothetical protein